MLIPTTRIERQFKRRRDGLWQEVLVHCLVYRDPDAVGVKVVQERLEFGGVYREATIYEHSFNGEAEWTDPNDKIKRRLLALTRPQPV